MLNPMQNQTSEIVVQTDLYASKGKRDLQNWLKFNQFAEMFWCEITRPEFYGVNGDFWRIIEYFELIKHDSFYKHFKEYAEGRNKTTNSIKTFFENNEEYINSGLHGYEALLAYILATEKNRRIKYVVNTFFEKYYDDCSKFISDKEIKRKYVTFDLNPEGFKTYSEAYCVLMARNCNRELYEEFANFFENEFKNYGLYLNVFDEHIKDYSSRPVDEVMLPFLSAYINYFESGIVNMNLLHFYIIVYELLSFRGGRFNTDLKSALNPLFLVFYTEKKVLRRDFGAKMLSAITEEMRAIYNDNDIMETNAFRSLLEIATVPTGLLQGDIEMMDAHSMLGDIKKRDAELLLYRYFSPVFILMRKTFGVCDTDSFINYLRETAYNLFRYANLKEKNRNIERAAKTDNSVWTPFYAFIKKEKRLREYENADITLYKTVKKEPKKQIASAETEQLKEKIAKLEEANKVLEKEKETYTKQTETIYALNRNLKKATERIGEIEKERESERKELIGLRNYMYELDNESNDENGEVSEVEYEEMRKMIDENVRGVMIGGHINLQNKCSAIFPSWKIFPTKKVVSSEILQHADLLVIYTDHIDHASYLSTMNNIKGDSNCKILYLHNCNLTYIVKQIYDFVMQ